MEVAKFVAGIARNRIQQRYALTDEPRVPITINFQGGDPAKSEILTR